MFSYKRSFIICLLVFGLFAHHFMVSATQTLDLRASMVRSVVLFSNSNTAYVNNNKREIGSKPFVQDGIILVPLRFISECYNLEVSWEGETQRVFIEYGTKVIEIAIDSKVMYVDNTDFTLSTAPIKKDDRVFIPLIDFCNILGKSVLYDKSGLIIISDKTDAIDTKYIDVMVGLFNQDYGVKPIEYYVSLKGNDSNDGTIEKPFATIEKAKATVKADIANGKMLSDIIVYIREGTYYINSSMTYTEEDSGQNFNNVIYKNYANEKVTIAGGREISNWSLYKGNIYKADVGRNFDMGLLYENGKMLRVARYPNAEKENFLGYLFSEDVFMPTSRIKFKKDTIPQIKNISDLEVYIWGGGGIMWFSNTLRVADLDYKNSLISTTGTPIYYTGATAGSRFYLQGALELLDAPGEYYFDKKAGIVYYYPTDYTVINKTITTSNVENILEFVSSNNKSPVHNIKFDGITIQNTQRTKDIEFAKFDKGSGAGVKLENSENITISNCVIHDVGGNGIYFTNYNKNNTIYGNLIYNLGASGVSFKTDDIFKYVNKEPAYLGAELDISQITNEGNVVSNNKIYNGSLLVGFGTGITSTFPDTLNNYINHNTISDFMRFGIEFTYPIGQNFIEYNDVSNVNTGSEDTGVIYTMFTSAYAPTMIRNNYIHNSVVTVGGASGIYNDENSNGVFIADNVVDTQGLAEKATHAMYTGSMFSKGVGLKIKNNIFANSNGAQSTILMSNSLKKPVTAKTEIDRNITYNHGKYGYRLLNWNDDYAENIDNNIFFNPNGTIEHKAPVSSNDEWLEFMNGRFDQNSKIENPMFMDGDNFDYRLRYDSVAHELGIKNVNVAKVGINADFKYSNQAEKLWRLYVKKSGLVGNNATINMKSGDITSLDITARTMGGYLADLSDAKIEFWSSDDSIATVDSKGNIIAHHPGVAKITTKVSKNNSIVNADMFVIVDDQLEDILFSKREGAIMVNKSLNLGTYIKTKFGQKNCEVLDNIEYTSSNASVLKVNNKGEMKSISSGDVIVTATGTLNGNNISRNIKFVVCDEMLTTVNTVMDKLTYEVGSIATMGIEGVDTSGGKMSLADANIEYSVDSEKVIVIKEKSNEHITIQCVGVGVAYIDIVAELNGIKVKNKQRITIVGESKLPAPWEIANFKNASGYVSEENGIFTLLSNGDNVYGNEDDATFMYQKVENTENYTITATINSVASVGSGNTASGLMIRSGNDANDYNLHLRLQGGAGLMMTYRNSDNLYSNYHKGPAVSLPVDIKLEKKGDIIGGYYKEDGKWILIAEYSVPTGNNSLAGIALFSNVADVFVDSKVSNINITK